MIFLYFLRLLVRLLNLTEPVIWNFQFFGIFVIQAINVHWKMKMNLKQRRYNLD